MVVTLCSFWVTLYSYRESRCYRDMARKFSHRLWTSQETAILRRYYGGMDNRRLSFVLGRGTPSISMKAGRMGLRCPIADKGEEFQEFLREKTAAGWSALEIAAYAQHGVASVRHWRQKLGLKWDRWNDYQRSKTRANTNRQCEELGIESLAHLRVHRWREQAREAGWPEDLPRQCLRILSLLWENGPMTFEEITTKLGVRHLTNGRCHYMTLLISRNLIIKISRAIGRGNKAVSIYSCRDQLLQN